MLLRLLAIQNYKSLRGIRWIPQDLSIIVGANAAGKTNFADSIDFLSEVYRHGLEVAVARKGGFENMAFRRMRRAKGAIAFEVCIEVSEKESRGLLPRQFKFPALRFQHAFSFGTKGSSIRAEFAVVRERLAVHAHDGDEWTRLATITRNEAGSISIDQPPKAEPAGSPDAREYRRWLDFSELRFLASKKRTLAPTELFTTSVGRYAFGLQSFIVAASGIRVFHISPTKSREFGVPVPRPELEGSGGNLPAVVDILKKNNPDEWRLILSAMQAILPQLREINVDYTSSRTLGLLFGEEGTGRPWSVGEVSDGTVQTLALLVTIFDPRYSALVLEEPENSVHPWIIRRLLEACKRAAKTKQIIITTHSPIVINAVSPENVFVMWRKRGESHLAALVEMDSSFLQAWQTGQVPTFDYFDSGALTEALPPSPTGERPSDRIGG